MASEQNFARWFSSRRALEGGLALREHGSVLARRLGSAPPALDRALGNLQSARPELGLYLQLPGSRDS